MINFRDNRGLTLVELIVAIAIGTIVAAAATAVLIMGLRIYSSSNKKALRQNEVRLAITVMENLAAEAVDVNVKENAVYSGDSEEPLLCCTGGAIYTDAGAKILEGVTGFSAKMDGNLLTIQFADEEDTYTFSVCCPVVSPPAQEETAAEILMTSIQNQALTPGVRAFLKVLASQLGSNGRILTEDGEGEYYSSWYIGGYENNPGWSEETPWCVCFISWAMEECRGYIQGQTMKFANVDAFWAELVTNDTWKEGEPRPGDIIFFDWNVDLEHNPEHAGVVFAVRDGWVHTIEGNSNNSVEICRYRADSPYILGYGMVNWN